MDSRSTPTIDAPPFEGMPTARPVSPSSDMPRPDGVRDTIESIVVAFILAFVFRAFIVEAFVIPTGSMAPGLYGLHGDHRCDLCKYPIVFGIREGRTGQGELPPNPSVRCPNCGCQEGRNSALHTKDDPVVPSSGDRILVLKWPYDLGARWLGPKRWDVVVFKDPQEGEQNYIKRLLGLPGEVLEIIDGDIYVAPADTVPADIREALSKAPPPGRPDGRRLNAEQQERLANLLRIQRKTPVAQESLWMVHYDHDFKPDLTRLLALPNGVPVWAAEQPHNTAWDVSTPRVKFKPADTREHWLQLTGKTIQDSYGYNSLQPSMQPSVRNVSDVRLRLVLVPGGTQGTISLDLLRGTDGFVAHLSADGTVRLMRHERGSVDREIDNGRTDALRPPHPVTIEFENVDYRVALRIDGAEVVATDESQYRPDVAGLLRAADTLGPGPEAAVRIGAKELPLEIRHLSVHRDVYYRSEIFTEESRGKLRNAFVHYPGWGTMTNPIYLRESPPDYFCLGDNSPQSKDSRLWWEVCPLLESRGDYQHGTVPGDQMIGRAFFVYWPGGYRFSNDTPAVIPNVGKMRIIR